MEILSCWANINTVVSPSSKGFQSLDYRLSSTYTEGTLYCSSSGPPAYILQHIQILHRQKYNMVTARNNLRPSILVVATRW